MEERDGPPFPIEESQRLLRHMGDSGVHSPPEHENSPNLSATAGVAGASSSSAEPDFGDEEGIDPGEQVMSLIKPVSVTMALVVFLVHEMGKASQQMAGTFSEIMVYREDASDSTGTILKGVMLNGLVVVAMLFFVTTFLLLLYKVGSYASIACCRRCCCRRRRRRCCCCCCCCRRRICDVIGADAPLPSQCRCYFVIYIWFFLSVSTLLFTFGGYVVRELLCTAALLLWRPRLPTNLGCSSECRCRSCSTLPATHTPSGDGAPRHARYPVRRPLLLLRVLELFGRRHALRLLDRVRPR